MSANAADCGMNPDELISDIHTMIDRTPDVLSDTIRDAALTEGEGTAAGRLLDGITAWLTRCRRSLESGTDTTGRPSAPQASTATDRYDGPLEPPAPKSWHGRRDEPEISTGDPNRRTEEG